jgi:hypothetical protein
MLGRRWHHAGRGHAGVTKERLQLRVERDSLAIEGVAQLDIPEGMGPSMRSTNHRRSLALSNERDTKHSVLTARVVRG